MMSHLASLLPLLLLVVSVIACGSSVAPALPATQPPGSLFATTIPAVISTLPPSATDGSSPVSPAVDTAQVPPPAEPQFTVSVIVDTTSQQVTQDQARAVIDEAGRFLREFSPYGLVMVDFAQDANGGSVSDIANRYMLVRSAFPPNGLVIFSKGDNGQAKLDGGYGLSLPLGGTFKNSFVSPAVGAAQIYVAVVDYGYKYMACGYGGTDGVQSTVSLAGECRGQLGIACVSHNGYSMCSNAVGNLYTSTPTYAVSSLIVHGLLHNFGPGGDRDHYATAECNARMGYPNGFFDLQESEYYNGLCPSVYEEFNKSYQP